MDAQVKTIWIEALRSGEYEQGKHALRKEGSDDKDRFCCLGVLCDVIRPVGWTGRKDDEHIFAYEGNARVDLPPRTFLDMVGMTMEQAKILATYNDNGDEFYRIANWIEVNL